MVLKECFEEMYRRFYSSPTHYKEAVFRKRNGVYYYKFSDYKYISWYLNEIVIRGIVKW